MVLNEIMDRYDDELEKVLPAYSEHRNPDAEAIVDLAMYNYVEVRRKTFCKAYLFGIGRLAYL